MKNLVMGAATGYAWQDLEPFVTSCKKFCPDADLVLFVDDISDFTRDKLIREGGTIEQFPPEFSDILIVNSRFKFYLDYLEAHSDDYAQVLVTDVRDVIFQGDVFAPFKNHSSYLGYSTEYNDIRGTKCGVDTNYHWIVNCFGKDAADKIADNTTVCAGTAAISTTKEMLLFLRMMIETNPRTDLWGSDQATLNYLVWNNLLPIENLIEFDVISGEIFTNGFIKDTKIRGDKILRGDGGVPSVVHQYDRHSKLVELVDRLYRDKNFTADEKFSDVRSVLEQVNHLLFLGKIDDAARLCMNTLPVNANFGGNVDRLLKIWERALNAPLTPAVGYLELLAQNTLMSAKDLSYKQSNKIFSCLVQSVKTRHVVIPQFKLVVLESLYTILEQSINAKAAAQCFQLIDLIKALDAPPNKKFLLLQAKANRIFGRKEQALAAYKAALELN